MEPLMLTPADAARALGVGRTKIYELMTLGLLESVHVGRCRRIPTAALAGYGERLRSTARGEVA